MVTRSFGSIIVGNVLVPPREVMCLIYPCLAIIVM